MVLLRGALNTALRTEELSSLYDEADGVLARALEDTLTRSELRLPPREEAVLPFDKDEDAPG